MWYVVVPKEIVIKIEYRECEMSFLKIEKGRGNERIE